MNIAVIEMDTHTECLYSFCKAFASSEHKLNIFVKERIYRELQSESFVRRFRWTVRPKQQSTRSFLRRNWEAIQQNDIIFIKTIDKSFGAYSGLDGKTPVVLRIHNLNSWFERRGHIQFRWTPYFIYKDLSYLIRVAWLGRDWYHIRRIVDNVDYLTFPSATIRQQALERALVEADKVGPVIPLAVHDPAFLKAPGDSITISVPGAIDERRRDYPMLTGLFQKLVPQLKKPLHLIYLGEPRGSFGRQTVARMQSLQHANFRFTSFDRRIPQADFNRYMQETDLLLSPLIVNTRYKIYRETYGYTKIAALESDVIRYGKPAILPAAYPISGPLRDLVSQYSSPEHLARILSEAVNGAQLHPMMQKTPQIMQQYVPQTVRKSIIAFFDRIIREAKAGSA